MTTLYASVTGLEEIREVNVSTSHSANSATATIRCNKINTIDIGDYITVDIGYVTDHDVVFRGYVKQINRNIPDNVYEISANDVMIRAIDYFIASSDPDDPYKKHNIAAEDLVRDLMSMAGLTSFTYDPTSFTFAVTDDVDVEVNLVSAFDYSSGVADLLTWHLWADNAGTVHFENRKPNVMTGASGQPGDDTDERPLGVAIDTLDQYKLLSISRRLVETDLRNRIVVYGNENIHAEKKSSTSYNPVTDTTYAILPTDFYKTAVLASPIIDDNSFASKIADYNLDLYNKLSESVQVSVIGRPIYLARNIIHVTHSPLSIDKNYYIFSSELALSSTGFVCNMELKR